MEKNDKDLDKLEKEIYQEVGFLKSDIAVLKTTINAMEKLLEKLITRPEFTPVKLLAYGMAGSILAGVIAALLALVIK
jgi:hypothetical protein